MPRALSCTVVRPLVVGIAWQLVFTRGAAACRRLTSVADPRRVFSCELSKEASMLDVMLCGASDPEMVREDFVGVIGDFGGSPLHYLSGDILYINAANSSWAANSSATVLAPISASL